MPKKISDLTLKNILGDSDSIPISDTAAGVDRRITGEALRKDIIFASVESVDDIRNTKGIRDNQHVRLISFHAGLSEGGGPVVWDAHSTEIDNGVTVFKPNSLLNTDPGRWKRQTGDNIKASWFGVVGFGYDGTDGTITAGTTTFTSSSADFDEKIIGSKIQIQIPGSENYFITTVVEINSSTSIELADAATDTLNGGTYTGGFPEKDRNGLISLMSYLTFYSRVTVSLPQGIVYNSTWEDGQLNTSGISHVTFQGNNTSFSSWNGTGASGANWELTNCNNLKFKGVSFYTAKRVRLRASQLDNLIVFRDCHTVTFDGIDFSWASNKHVQIEGFSHDFNFVNRCLFDEALVNTNPTASPNRFGAIYLNFRTSNNTDIYNINVTNAMFKNIPMYAFSADTVGAENPQSNMSLRSVTIRDCTFENVAMPIICRGSESRIFDNTYIKCGVANMSTYYTYQPDLDLYFSKVREADGQTPTTSNSADITIAPLYSIQDGFDIKIHDNIYTGCLGMQKLATDPEPSASMIIYGTQLTEQKFVHIYNETINDADSSDYLIPLYRIKGLISDCFAQNFTIILPEGVTKSGDIVLIDSLSSRPGLFTNNIKVKNNSADLRVLPEGTDDTFEVGAIRPLGSERTGQFPTGSKGGIKWHHYYTVPVDGVAKVFGTGTTSPGKNLMGVLYVSAVSTAVGKPEDGTEENFGVFYIQTAATSASQKVVTIHAGLNLETVILPDNTNSSLSSATAGKISIQIGGGNNTTRLLHIYNRLSASRDIYVSFMSFIS